jgi:hypothetical protein
VSAPTVMHVSTARRRFRPYLPQEQHRQRNTDEVNLATNRRQHGKRGCNRRSTAIANRAAHPPLRTQLTLARRRRGSYAICGPPSPHENSAGLSARP